MERSTVAILLTILVVGSAGAFSLANSTPVSGTVPVSTQSGVTVNVADNGGEMNLQDPWVDANTVNISTSAGNATVSGSGSANLTLKSISGETNITNADVDQNDVEINPEDKPAVVIGGGLQQFNYSGTVNVDDSTPEFGFGGSGADSTVKITNAPENRQIAAVDSDTGEFLDISSSDANGNVTFTMPNSEHVVELHTNNDSPTITDPSPNGNLTSAPSKLEINVSDGDMPNDNLTATFELDGSVEGADSRDDNGALSVPVSNVVAGEHTVDVTVEDAYGNTETESYSFRVPDTMTIRNESNGSQVLEGVEATITFQSSDQVITRTSNANGNISLEGYPVGQPYFVTLEKENYSDRQVALTNIYNQQEVYMLNESENSVNVRFQITDRTGSFPPERAVLIIERPITQDFDGDGQDETRLYRIASDQLGVQGSLFTLENNERYRIAVRNTEGDVRQLGSYETIQNETVDLEIGSVSLQVGGQETYATSTEFINETDPTIKYDYVDPQDETEDLNVTIYERGNSSNVTFSKTYPGPVGNVSITHILSQQEAETTFVVEWQAERNGEQISGSSLVGSRMTFGVPLSPLLKSVIAVGLIIILAGLFGGVQAELGAIVVTLVAGGLWLVQWLPSSIGIGAILLALAIAVLSRINSQPEVV